MAIAGLCLAGAQAVAPSDPAPEPATTQALSSLLDPASIGIGLFYAVPSASSTASFRAHADQVDVIAPQSFALDRLGHLKGSLPDDLTAIAQAHQIAVMPLVINAGFSRYGAEHLLRYRADRKRAIDALVQQARDFSFSGWQIDFENLPSSERAAFSRFVDEAAEALHNAGKMLSVAVAARTDDADSHTYRTFSGVYDYAKLGRSADFLTVMAYPESGSDPGPLASYPWVEQVIQHVLQSVPPEKISLGLPTYESWWGQRRVRVVVRKRVKGRIHHYIRYEWRPSHTSGQVTESDADNLQWDPVLKSPYLIAGEGHDRQVTWLEDDRSFASKLELIAKYHLRGFSAWRIGLEDPAIWNILPGSSQPQVAQSSSATGEASGGAATTPAPSSGSADNTGNGGNTP